MFEIGTFTGLTSWTLARNLDGAQVHTLDLPPDEVAAFELEGSDEFHPSTSTPMAYESIPLRGGSVSQHWSDSARFDSKNALAMIGDDGAVVWDDYWRLSPGVSRTLNAMASERPLYRVPGTRLVVFFAPAARTRFLNY